MHSGCIKNLSISFKEVISCKLTKLWKRVSHGTSAQLPNFKLKQ